VIIPNNYLYDLFISYLCVLSVSLVFFLGFPDRQTQTNVCVLRSGILTMKYVAYYRVSTVKQGKSGLGLEAQKESVRAFVEKEEELIGEYVEVQSGRKDNREELWKAIRAAKEHKAKIVIARLDRFSRKVSFISGIMDQGVSLVVAEMPHATEFQLHIFAALAQEERRLISERTKAALAQAKKRGVRLGKNGAVLAVQRKHVANEKANRMLNTIPFWWMLTYSELARQISTYSDRRVSAQTVKNWIERLRRERQNIGG
jgi:DNA invertase Pin-like site-specific DNA recombinase